MKHAMIAISPTRHLHIYTQPEYNQLYLCVTDEANNYDPVFHLPLVVYNQTQNTFIGYIPVTPTIFVCPSFDANEYTVMWGGIPILEIIEGGELHSLRKIQTLE